MGTYYTLGIIQNFIAQSEKALPEEKWHELLNERVNLDLFEIKLIDGCITGVLKDKLFEDNIKDFYCKLKKITNDNDIDSYFKEDGVQLTKYQTNRTRIYLDENQRIALVIEYILLFVEGKVLVEEFSIEPKLMNWLFRHCDFGNCLAGSVISGITG